MDVPVLVSVAGPGEPALVRAISTTPGLAVSRRCADVTELLAMAAAGRGALAVISASHLGIDREVVDRLHRAGVGVVGIAASEDATRVAALGCDAVVDNSAAPQVVVAALRELGPLAQAQAQAQAQARGANANRAPQQASTPGGSSPGGFVPAGFAPAGSTPGGPTPNNQPASAPTGQVVAVWGTVGAPGRSTTATTLARLLADRAPTCLVDADTRAPALAQILGITEERAGIALAARAAANGRLNQEVLETALRQVGPLAVLIGLTRPDRWREVPGSALEEVLAHCKEQYTWTVVDVAGGWEDDSADSFGPARDSAREVALANADVVVILGAADPVGVWRLVELLAIRPRIPGREIVAVSRSRRSVTGPAPEQAVREALARFAGVGEVLIIPDDRNAFDAALQKAAFLPEVARSSPALAAISQLAVQVTGERLRRTLFRRAAPRHQRAR